MTYDARNRTATTEAECRAAIGREATLPLTGRITDVRTSESGAFVVFEIDDRWGFGSFRVGVDLEALEVTDAS